ncbi:MAG: tetratricopeptide repeat protein [Moorea sp. SIO2B7]|nr:tetratricopeptide repeat protein [Moorena sp. SIO2B7]
MNQHSEQSNRDYQKVDASGKNNQQYFTQSGDIYVYQNQPESESQKTATETTKKVYENLGRRGISTEQFKGRDEDLNRLYELLQNNSQVAITAAVMGMGGVGKTELAIQYARKYLSTYQGGVGWFSARDFALKLLEFARSQFDNIFIPDGVGLEAQIQACWRQWVEGEVLLVIDDVTNYRLEIKHYLPEHSKFKILLTSRLRFQNSIVPLDLEMLKRDDALKLLKFWVGKEKIEAELEHANKICEWLGDLPLGLELVGRYMKDEELTLGEILGELQEIRLQHPALDQENYSTITAQLGVRDAINLSWQRLDEKAQILGCVLGVFALAEIQWQWVENIYQNWSGEGFNKIELRNFRKELLRRHLLKGKESYTLHQLVWEFLREKLEELDTKEEIKQAFVGVMVAEAKEIPETLTLDIIHQVTSTIPHLEEVAENLSAYLSDNDFILPFERIYRFYEFQTLFQQQEIWAKDCLNQAKQYFGEEHRHVATSLNNLARLYRSQGKYEQAEALFVKALEMRKKLLGEEHLKVAISLNNLARLYRSQGKYEQAEPLYVQALAMKKKLLGEEHLKVAISLNNLAELYRSQGKYEQAEPLYVKALDMRKKLLGEEHPKVATSLNYLGELYRSQGKYDQAESLFLQALAMRRRLLGEEHPDVVTSLNYLAELYRSQGKYEQAEPLFLQALEMDRKLLGDDHPHTTKVKENLEKCRAKLKPE